MASIYKAFFQDFKWSENEFHSKIIIKKKPNKSN